MDEAADEALRAAGAVGSVVRVQPSPFDVVGPVEPLSPVMLSVPHAGRDYPPALQAALRVALDAVLPLEDRHVDRLARAAHAGETMIIARRPRAWIDLNRAEHERDPQLDDGANPMTAPFASAKVRGGLGLVPRRIGRVGDIWRRRFTADEVVARIVADHRPYHNAVAAALRAAQRRFGQAVLVDLHSMPPLVDGAAVVIGDRFGRSAAGRFVARAEAAARNRGVTVAINTPYPGGHILDRHGAPQHGIHAIQIEIDRRMYLDTSLREVGPGLADAAALLRAMLDALIDEAAPLMQAAE